MKLTIRLQRAIDLAADLHSEQLRKAVNLPYIVHPFGVAWILENYTDDEDVIVAGLLHDVFEDVDNECYERVRREFGKRVADIVKEVSEDKDPKMKIDEKGTWEDRKRKYLENLKTASKEAMLVSAADKIQNLLSMIQTYNEQGGKMWSYFNASPEKVSRNFRDVLEVLKEYLKNPIIQEYEDSCSALGKILDAG